MVFVTGGTGLIGSHLLFELCRRGEKVKALKRRSSNLNQVLKTFSYYTDAPEKLFSKIEWIEGELLDYYSIENLLKGVDAVYHSAGMVSFRSSERNKMISNNVTGTANLVNAALAARVKRFCHVSSVSALGKVKNGTPVNEETVWVPSKKNSGYSESKFFSELEVWRGIEEGLQAVIVNPSIVIGPGDWQRSSPRLFTTVWKGIRFYTTGTTGFIGVNDVVASILTLMDPQNFARCRNQRFLLSGENIRYRDFFNQVAAEFNKRYPVYFASNFMLEIAWRGALLASFLTGREPAITKDAVLGANKEYLFDGSKITKETGFRYSSLKDAITQTAQCFLKDIQPRN